MAVARRNPSRVNKTANPAEARLRKRVFVLCHELGLEDEQRQAIAGQLRKDGICSMQKMRAADLFEMVKFLSGKNIERQNREVKEHREKRLSQKKRVDDDKSPYASERARHTLRQWAEDFYGANWEAELNLWLGGWAVSWFKRTARLPEGTMRVGDLHYLPWNCLTIPRKLHYEAMEGMKARMGRAVRRKT